MPILYDRVGDEAAVLPTRGDHGELSDEVDVGLEDEIVAA